MGGTLNDGSQVWPQNWVKAEAWRRRSLLKTGFFFSHLQRTAPCLLETRFPTTVLNEWRRNEPKPGTQIPVCEHKPTSKILEESLTQVPQVLFGCEQKEIFTRGAMGT